MASPGGAPAAAPGRGLHASRSTVRCMSPLSVRTTSRYACTVAVALGCVGSGTIGGSRDGISLATPDAASRRGAAQTTRPPESVEPGTTTDQPPASTR